MRIVVTGGTGFLGRHVVQEFQKSGVEVYGLSSAQYDLRQKTNIKRMLKGYDPDVIVHLAAHVGGIGLNQAKPAELFLDNALMGILLMDEAYRYGVKKFVQIGTICSYPNLTPVPFKEEDIWNGYPEETNAPYGLAKKMLLVQGQAYRKQYGFNVIHLLPVNLYGPGDNFNLTTSHVIPALIQKFDEAVRENKPEVQVWGTGKATREFLYVEDAARAIVMATQHYDEAEPVNIGSGMEHKIEGLVRLIATKVGYKGKIVFDSTKPDGQPRRCLDTMKARLNFSFVAQVSLLDGLDRTIAWYREHR